MYVRPISTRLSRGRSTPAIRATLVSPLYFALEMVDGRLKRSGLGLKQLARSHCFHSIAIESTSGIDD
jgi:hypothetical protein